MRDGEFLLKKPGRGRIRVAEGMEYAAFCLPVKRSIGVSKLRHSFSKVASLTNGTFCSDRLGMMASGIYRIVNRVNAHCYIGSALDLDKRRAAHWSLLRKGKHHSKHLQAAWNKYGTEAFDFEVLEECSSEALIVREQYYIDRLHPTYNVCPVAGNCLGKKHTPEAKAKVSAANKGRKPPPEEIARRAASIRRVNAERIGPHPNKGRKMPPEGVAARVKKITGRPGGMKGKHHSKEAKAKMSVAAKGRPTWNKGVPHSEEWKAKMSASMKGRKCPWLKGKAAVNRKLTLEQAEAIRTEYEVGIISQRQLADQYGVHQRVIWQIIHNKRYITND